MKKLLMFLFCSMMYSTLAISEETVYYNKIKSINPEMVDGQYCYVKIIIKEVNDFDDFWNLLLIPNLKLKHNVTPVHSIKEISLLKNKFNNNIRQFNVYYENDLVAGATIFETKTTAHVQYISSNNTKNELGSLDFLFNYLIKNTFSDKLFFDFGNSNEENGQKLNKGLLYWKEGFGAKYISQDFYKIETLNFNNLDNLFV